MKHRILTHLYDLSHYTTGAAADTLMQAHGWDRDTLRARSRTVLSHILHQYAHFSVSTIDSFFQRIVRGFAQELGLQSGFRIELDQGHVLAHVAQTLINTASQSPLLRQWLVAFAEDKLLNGQHWDFERELLALGWELLAEPFSMYEAQLRQVMQDPDAIRQLLKQLHQQIHTFEIHLQRWGQQAQQAIQQAGLAVDDFAYGKSGVAGYLTGLVLQKKYPPTQRALRALDQPTAWYSQKCDKASRIAEVVQVSLQPCLQAAVRFYDTHHRAYYTAIEVRRFVYALGIATKLLEQLSDYRAAHNVMLVSDTTLFLHKVIAENDTPFVYEKAGTYYKHFLIDEFQDISRCQWRNLQPLVSNGLTEGHDSLVVGDVKQSIYRWRGGDWRLLHTQLQEDVASTATVSLDSNWRSKPHIIDFNNTFFATAIATLVQHLSHELTTLTDSALRQTLLTQVQQLEGAYKDVRQHLPPQRTDMEQGYVRITLLEETTTQEGHPQTWRDIAKKQLIARIEALQLAGVAPKGIAILVRNNAEGRDVVQALLAHRQSPDALPQCQYDVVSAASLYLSHSPWISIIVHALKCLHNDADTLAQATLHHLHQQHVLHCEDDGAVTRVSHRHAPQGSLVEALVVDRVQLLQLPLYELIETLICRLQLRQAAAIPFLQAFQDLVLTFTAQECADVSHFLGWWEQRGSRYTLPNTQAQDAITLMTIHQAKGLQFKVVMIPFCAWDLDHSPHHPPTLWCSTQMPPFDAFPVLPVRYSRRLKDTAYAQDYYQEHMQAYLDNLNLLYVAFTRPEDQLYVWAQRPSKEQLKTTADLLQQTLAGAADWARCWDAKGGILEIGQLPMAASATTAVPSPSTPAVPMCAPSEPSLAQALLAAPMPMHSAQAQYGVLVHQVLAHVHEAEDVAAALDILQAAGEIDQTIREQLMSQLTALLHQPRVRDWFSAQWEVKSEATILSPAGQMLRPDRVLMRPGQVVVIDFKTGIPQSYHKQQVQAYAALLYDMGHPQVEAYLLYTATGQVVLC